MTQMTFIALRPQVLVSCRVNQLGGNSHASAVAHDRPFYNRVHVQIGRDFPQRFASSFVQHGGGAGGYAKVTDLSQCSNKRLGQAVREILLLRIVREIF